LESDHDPSYTYWCNAEIRSYVFVDGDEENASIIETDESRERRKRSETPLGGAKMVQSEVTASATGKSVCLEAGPGPTSFCSPRLTLKAICQTIRSSGLLAPLYPTLALVLSLFFLFINPLCWKDVLGFVAGVYGGIRECGEKQG